MTQGREGVSELGSRQFMLQRERTDGAECIRVLGEMDLSVVGQLDSEMRRAEATDATSIELDLDQLEFLDAAGLRLLLRLKDRSLGSGRLRIRPASSRQVRRVLELTGVGELLPIKA